MGFRRVAGPGGLPTTRLLVARRQMAVLASNVAGVAALAEALSQKATLCFNYLFVEWPREICSILGR